MPSPAKPGRPGRLAIEYVPRATPPVNMTPAISSMAPTRLPGTRVRSSAPTSTRDVAMPKNSALAPASRFGSRADVSTKTTIAAAAMTHGPRRAVTTAPTIW